MAAARSAAAAVLADAHYGAGDAIEGACGCSVAQGVKRLLNRFDEMEVANKKRRAATNLQVKQLKKQQTATSAELSDAKRVLSHLLKAVNSVGTAIGHGTAVTRELCRTVDQRGPAVAASAGAAISGDVTTAATFSPALLDVPRKAPWTKDLVVIEAMPAFFIAWRAVFA